jgi:hypothetical protein
VVARDDQDSILKCWTKAFCSCDAVVDEAEAILWAVQIVQFENFHSVIIERDAKVCFDTLNGDLEKCSWTIASRCNDMVELSKEFVSCNFCWIKRDANLAKEWATKFASCNKLTFSCNISSSSIRLRGLEGRWFPSFCLMKNPFSKKEEEVNCIYSIY